MKKAKSFFFAAIADIRSAQVLFQIGEFPNAVYHLQQAAEKLSKCFGILNGWLEADNNHLRKVGHNGETIFSSLLKEQMTEFEEAASVSAYFPHAIFPSTGLQPKERVFFDKFRHSARKLSNLRSSDLTELTIEEVDNVISIICGLDTLTDEVMESIRPVIRRLITNRLIDILSLGVITLREHSEISQSLLNQSFIEEPLQKLKPAIPYFLRAYNTCFFVSLLTAAHNQTTRYPSENFNVGPAEIYGSEHPLVQRFVPLHNLLVEAVLAIDILYFPEEVWRWSSPNQHSK